MKKLLAIALTLVLTAAVFAGCSGNESAPDTTGGTSDEGAAESENTGGSQTLNIFTWATYFPDDILEEFTAETGIKINYTNFESNEDMLEKLQAADGGDYDIVLASDYIIDIARGQGGLLADLDKSKIPNYSNIDPNFQGQYYDPDDAHTIPYAAGTPLIIYNPDLVDIEITGYADLWDPSLENKVVVVDDARNILGIALKTMGESFNTTDEDTIRAAGEKLVEPKPNLVALDYNNPHSKMISGEAAAGYMFTSQIMEAQVANPDLKVVYPAEGMGFGIDCIFVPKNAPNMDNAHTFINFILDGEIGARISSQIYYICCNSAAAEYLPEEFKSNESLYIPSEVMGQTEFIQDVGADVTELYDQVWTTFKQS